LNLALAALKRLTQKGEFTNSKSIDETQREYELNSNPIATFMDECTEPRNIDIDKVTLYSTYNLWVKFYGKKKIEKNQFGKELKKLGYEKYRENVPGRNCNQKITKFVDIQIRSDAQDRLIPKNGDEACPIYTESPDIGKTNLGQAGQAFILSQTSYDNSVHSQYTKYHKVNESEPSPNITISENLPTRRDQACPKMRFLDNERHRASSQDNLVNVPVLDQKVINYEQSEEDNIIKKDTNIKALRTDLKNLVINNYNCRVESIPDLLNDFNRRYPGYNQVLGYQDLQNEAEKLNSWGWT